jgi:hypothetical protein
MIVARMYLLIGVSVGVDSFGSWSVEYMFRLLAGTEV